LPQEMPQLAIIKLLSPELLPMEKAEVFLKLPVTP